MKNSDNLIYSHEEYQSIRKEMLCVFNMANRLPEQVFANGFTQFRFLDFDQMLTEEFWNVLSKCAALNESEIHIIMEEPSAKDYYYSNFQRYGALKLKYNASPEEYYELLSLEPEQSPADALIYVANTLSWFDSSRTWGIWGERHLGVGIAASIESTSPWLNDSEIKWYNTEQALSQLLPLNFHTYTVPDEFAQTLKRNYPCS